MLRSLHIKNLALAKDIDVSFGPGLNILTGETGAGKSILIESIAAALGGKMSAEMVRDDADTALAELMFEVSDPKTLSALKDLGIPVEDDGSVLIVRRIRDGRTQLRINDESFTLSAVKKAAPYLLDIYGQNEHQTLLDTASQLALIDSYGGEAVREAKRSCSEAYRAARTAKDALDALNMNEEERLRRIDLITYEWQEITDAAPSDGEDEELEAEYRKLGNGRKIISSLSEAHKGTGYDGGAGDLVGEAVHVLSGIAHLDPDLKGLHESIASIDSLLADFNRGLMSYMDSFSFDEERLTEIESRLNVLNRLKAKYGGTIEKVIAEGERREAELDTLHHYEEEKKRAEKEAAAAAAKLDEAASALTDARSSAAERFVKDAAAELSELNFAQVDFSIELSQRENCGPNGRDAAEFMISTNIGEERRPLRKVASGGELSRIMLGIKAMFAGSGSAETLIFDEIDTGISGRTAQKVGEKLRHVSEGRQVLCITHLPQIASMADAHYLVEKSSEDGKTQTKLRLLDGEKSVEELARMIGGARITERTLRSAAEMKAMVNTEMH